jgi:hypothetical protein
MATTDAVPEAKADSGSMVITVLDSTASFTTKRAVVPPGPLAGVLTLAHSHGLGGTAEVVFRGPANPPDGDCSSADWAKAKPHVVATRAVSGDHRVGIRTTSLSQPGCYLVAGAIGLTVPGGAVAQVPIRLDSPVGVVFLLRPTLALATDQPWADSPNPIGTHITVRGTFGQPGTVRVLMRHVPAGVVGCRGVHFTNASSEASGPVVHFTGDGTYRVRSGRTPRNGCYSLVPTLTMDANPAVRATGRVGLASSIVTAGMPVTDITIGRRVEPKPLEDPSDLTVWPALIGFLLVATGISIAVLKIANDARKPQPHRPSPGLGLLD